MKNIFVTIAAAVVLIGAFTWISRPSDSPVSAGIAQGTPLAAEETFFDFGTISMAKGVVTHLFPVRGNATVTKLFTSCVCTTASPVINGGRTGPFGMPGHGVIPQISKAVLADNEAYVEVAFDPEAHGPAGVGKIDRTVTVETETSSPLSLRIAAFVTP
jgi:hypothetical protein